MSIQALHDAESFGPLTTYVHKRPSIILSEQPLPLHKSQLRRLNYEYMISFQKTTANTTNSLQRSQC
jgi:hypothetical protein